MGYGALQTDPGDEGSGDIVVSIEEAGNVSPADSRGGGGVIEQVEAVGLRSARAPYYQRLFS